MRAKVCTHGYGAIANEREVYAYVAYVQRNTAMHGKQFVSHDDATIFAVFDTAGDVVWLYDLSDPSVPAVQADDQHTGVPWVKLCY